MVAERQFQSRCYRRLFIFVFAVIVFLSPSGAGRIPILRSFWKMGSPCVFAEEQSGSFKPARYRVFSLKHISAEQGKKYLAEAEIGTVSQLPGSNTLLVTAQPRELIKASAILKLVDAKEQFVIKVISPVSESENLPSNEQIEEEIGSISIGTFYSPPAGDAAAKAIIDVHKNVVLAVAEVSWLDKITSAVEKLAKTKSDTAQPNESGKLVEPTETTGLKPEAIAETEARAVESIADTDEGEEDEFFDKLLSSLAEAEKMAAESVLQKARKTGTETESQQVGTAAKAAEVKDVVEEPTPAHGSEEPAVKIKQPDEKGPILRKDSEMEAEVAGPTAPVRRSYEPEPIDIGDEMLELDLPEKLNVIDLLDLIGKYLNLNYMYNEADVKGQEVSLRVQGPIKVKDLYPLLESVLQFKGFVMSRKVNLVTIVKKERVLEIDPVLLGAEKGTVEAGDVIVTRIFKLKHVDTASAQNLLNGMKLGADIKAIAETGTLIVTGYAYRMRRVEELLEMIDKPGKPKKFRFRQLKYTMAKTLAPKVKALAEQLGTISITVAAPAKEPAKPTGRRLTAAQRRAAERRAAAERAKRPPAAAPAVTPTVYLDADERTNRILMIGLEEQLALVDELIDSLDVEQQDLRTLRLYEIQYVGAEEIREKLTELGIISGEQAGRERARRERPRAATSARAQTARTTTTQPTTTTTEEAPVEEPQVVVIETTNSLLVNATAEQHVRVAMIIGYVDAEPEEAAINYKVYPLENQDPEELADVLTKLIQETITERDAKDAKIIRETTRRTTEEDITIVPDPKTYSLIVYASKKNQQWISSLIKQLDEYRPQVLLDVTLVEITKSEEFKLDLDLVTKHPTLAAGASMVNPIFSGILEPFPGKRILEVASIAGAGGAGFYADEHIQALLEAMDKKGYGRVLARPKLLVNDNEAGTIKSEETQFVARKDTKVLAGTTATTSTTATSVTFESFTAGIGLEIEPHISKGDQLRLQITLTRTDFRPPGDPIIIDGEEIDKPLNTITSDVTTVVTVPDGTTIILGGLETLKQSKGGTKVPLLGDIPLIGGLFRSTANTDTQSRLYVFVKAHILRPGEELTGISDIEVVSRKNRAAFEEFEREFQELEDWPGFKPKPMDPVRILEVD